MEIRRRCDSRDLARSRVAGATLLEVLIVVLVVGILVAIAVSTWQKFVSIGELNSAQSKAYQAMRAAQSYAKRDKIAWQASFRSVTANGREVVQWAVHSASLDPNKAPWNNFPKSIRLDGETTLKESNGVRRALFNYKGCPVNKPEDECGKTSLRALGRLTFSSTYGGEAKRCVFVSTLLGALRESKQQAKSKDGKYCY